jgi:hypothetical protein
MHGGSRTPVYGSRRIRYGGIQAVGDSCGVGAYASAEGRAKAEFRTERMGAMRLTEAEVEALPVEKRLDECPLCGCKKHESHQRCFHCTECEYLQCCDYDGYYDRARKAVKAKTGLTAV